MTYRELVVLYFVLNGLSGIVLKVLGGMDKGAGIPTALAVMYIASVVPAALVLRSRKGPVQQRSIGIGVLAGVGSAVGTAAFGYAIRTVPGHIAFPVTSGGTLVLVALIGFAIFREKVGPYGMAGIALGAVAVILLSV